MSRFRLLLATAVLFAFAGALVACGGDSGDGGSSEDPQKVLDQTFSGDNEKVDSGVFSLKISGGGEDAEVSGPFVNQGEGKVPQFEVTATVNASDLDFEGGLISTGDAAFVNYKDTDYEVDQSLFDRVKQSIEQSAGQEQANQQSAKEFLDQLGISDPKSLLTNLSHDGTEDVEGTETNHISGDLDIARTVDGLKNLLGNASALGALGGASSSVPSPEELDQLKEGIKEAHFDIYSGVDDHILRRATISLSLDPPDGDAVDLNFDFTLSHVNESQTIEAPANPKAFNDLLSALGIPPGALGALGALGSGGGLGGIGGGSGGGGQVPALPGGGAGAEQAQKYLTCISQASTATDLQQCQSLAP